MGRSDYLVSAGIGFDLDRSSARKSIGIFEGLAGTLNQVATKKAAEGFAKTEQEYAKTIKGLKEINDQADKDLVEGTAKSAQAAQDALNKSMMKPPSKASVGAIKAAGGLEEYKKEYAKTVGAMKSSYGKFAKEAEKIGIKFSKGSKINLEEFAKKDVETRKQAINLTKRMIKDEKNRLKTLTEGSKGYKELSREIKHLEQQEKQMVNLSEDVFQQERKNQKIKNESAKKERKAEKKKITAQKKIIQHLKTIGQHTSKIGRLAQDSAGKIAGGFQNAFVIGTAAATAFFYKMEPLAETVQEFERTLINANSVFNVSKDVLFDVSDTMVQFTLKYGVSAQETATGLYQLASAGLDAAESQEVLQHTMKLAMATQGDHNTLAKLTTQTIMGFGMSMSDAGMLTDKFAHSIQKSLIEWQDLASSVKFAMPFFVATGQSIDQLLGGLEVLTNRALEAGIAGRGLRQALAQFAKHANNNASALAKMGVQIMGTNGEMRELSAIAKDAQLAFGDVSGTEQLTAMLEDMNVRGATAFALLVQNADEFEEAVANLANSAGEATLMADIQQESLANQIQLVKNALLAPFLFSDEVGEANNTLNEFTFRISELVKKFTEFFIVVGPNGEAALSKHSENIKIFVIAALEEAILIIQRFKDIFMEQEGLESFTELLQLAVKPLHLVLDVVEKLGPNFLVIAMKLKVLNSILPITNILMMIMQAAMFRNILAMNGMSIGFNVMGLSAFLADKRVKALNLSLIGQGLAYFSAVTGLAMYDKGLKMFRLTASGVMMTMGGMMTFMMLAITTTGAFSDAMLALAAVMVLLNTTLVYKGFLDLGLEPFTAGLATAATMATFLAGMVILRNKAQGMFSTMGSTSPSFGGTGMQESKLPTERMYDSGGMYTGARMYDMGGPTTEHGMAVLQKGETIIPKTRNMLEGGITLNIGGDIVTDNAEDFAERIAQVLPEALRKQNDIGGI